MRKQQVTELCILVVGAQEMSLLCGHLLLRLL
jgi:hypothetical protein